MELRGRQTFDFIGYCFGTRVNGRYVDKDGQKGSHIIFRRCHVMVNAAGNLQVSRQSSMSLLLSTIVNWEVI